MTEIPTKIKIIIKKGSPRIAPTTNNITRIIPKIIKSVFFFEAMIYIIERGF